METKCEQLVDSEVLSSGSKEVEENDECDDGNDDGNEGCKESEQSTKYAKESVNEGNLDSCEQEEFDTVKTDLNIKHFEKSDKNESGSSPELNDKPPPLDAVNMEKSSKSIRTSQEEGSLENGKRKIKEEKTPTKVVVRRLPPSMTKEMFLDQVSPLPPVDYVYFLSANLSMGIHAFARAYLNFINQEDLFAFTRTFDNYVFLDAKGQEYPAVVEFAPFQRVPKHRITGKKKDPLCGTVECDPNYKAFKDTFLAEENEASKPNIVKQHYFETENQNMASNEEVETTPLLEFLKARRAEKARIKEEKREEKRRRDAERKLKQQQQQQQQKKKADESPQDLKVLQPPGKDKDKKDIIEKEGKLNMKRDVRLIKDKQEKLPKEKTTETRTREFKNRTGGKSYQEERQKQAERREEQRKKSSSDGGSNGGSQGNDDREGEKKTETVSNVDSAKKKIGGGEGRMFTGRKRKEEYGGSRRKEREERRSRTATKVYKNSQEGKRGDWKEGNGNKGNSTWRNSSGGGNESEVVAGKEADSKKGDESRESEEVDGGRNEEATKRVKKENGENQKGDKVRNDEEHQSEGSSKKDLRLVRRIRNKDRPSLEIYRPGMGKFSKQRLEKEQKILGSSTEVESTSHSPSPTSVHPSPHEGN